MFETSVIHSDKSVGTSFVRIDNAALQDKRLSFRARGVLAYVLSQPPEWSHSANRLAEASTEGEKAIVSALKELEALGYSWLEKSRDQRGTVRNRRRFRETPTPGKGGSVTETLKTEVGNRPPKNRPPVDRPPVNRPVGEGGVYETTTKKLLLEQQPSAAAPLTLPGMENTATRPVSPKHQQRPRNSLFDALAVACGNNLAEMTERAAKACGVALNEIRRACPDVTPEEIRRRADNFRRANRPDYRLTPSKFVLEWSTLGTASAATTTTPVRFCQ